MRSTALMLVRLHWVRTVRRGSIWALALLFVIKFGMLIGLLLMVLALLIILPSQAVADILVGKLNPVLRDHGWPLIVCVVLIYTWSSGAPALAYGAYRTYPISIRTVAALAQLSRWITAQCITIWMLTTCSLVLAAEAFHARHAVAAALFVVVLDSGMILLHALRNQSGWALYTLLILLTLSAGAEVVGFIDLSTGASSFWTSVARGVPFQNVLLGTTATVVTVLSYVVSMTATRYVA